MFTHCEQLGYLDFYTLTKLSVILPHGVCKITNFKFEKTSNGPSAKKINAVGILHRSVLVKTLPLRGRVSI
jgi:hypothetical protein